MQIRVGPAKPSGEDVSPAAIAMLRVAKLEYN
jgi:hypothetical protein